MPTGELLLFPHIHNIRMILHQPPHLVHVDLTQPPRQHIGRHQSRHVHRILGRGEQRGVAVLIFPQILYAAAHTDQRRHHIDTLIHLALPDSLCAQQLAGGHFKQQLQCHIVAVRHNAHFVRGIHSHMVKRHACGLRPPGVQPHRGGIQSENADAGRPDKARVFRRDAADMVSGDTCLLLRRPGQCQPARQARLPVEGLRHIAHRVDVRVAGLHIAVHPNAPGLTDGKPRLLGQRRFRRYADGEDHRVGGNDLLRLHAVRCTNHADTVVLHRRDRAGHDNSNAVVIQLLLDRLHHVMVKGCQDLRHPLHNGHVFPRFSQVLRHLYADKTAADDHDILCLIPIHTRLYRGDVLHVPNGVYVILIHTAYVGGDDRRCACRQHQLVIGHVAAVSRSVPHRYCFRGPVDTQHLVARMNGDIVFLTKLLRRRHNKISGILHHAAKVIRQGTV